MRIRLILVLMFLSQIGLSQESNLNAYKHVIVPMQFDFQSESNQYQLNILSRVLLKEEGFEVYMDKEERPMELLGDTCAPLFFEIEDTSGFLNISLIVRLKDCYDNVIFESEEVSTKIKKYKEGYQAALKQAFTFLADENYRYDENLSPAPFKSISNVKKKSSGSADEVTESGSKYPNKKIYKFGGETYWLIEQDKNFILLTSEGKVNYAELETADRGTYIFNSGKIIGAAFFDANGNLNVEYMDEDLGEIQHITFRKID
ncbi:hypothetical protein LB452_01065 [Psychroflexus sp. CAK8W]|uniref:Uncharacterized protein n=1 Tax=Psychroflexus longus TaxID=2873596 RepID=A0ABS7XGE5_9FLAO|nr:hypothetical protein [Psychroflexus longus]MBZ9777499.1 hypothetical protein [Psychroflexus longus]